MEHNCSNSDAVSDANATLKMTIDSSKHTKSLKVPDALDNSPGDVTVSTSTTNLTDSTKSIEPNSNQNDALILEDTIEKTHNETGESMNEETSGKASVANISPEFASNVESELTLPETLPIEMRQDVNQNLGRNPSEPADYSQTDSKAASDDDSEADSDDSDNDSGSDFLVESDLENQDSQNNDRLEEIIVDAPLRSAHELAKLPPVEPVSIEIPLDMECVSIGLVHAVVDDMVIVQGDTCGTQKVLDSDSILVFENREILGRIFDTFGPVIKPMYSIRFNSVEEIQMEKVSKGTRVFCMPQLANFVFTQTLKQKGSDASNFYDEEVGIKEMEFSDDEKEAEHKARLKAKRSLEEGEVVDSLSKRQNNPRKRRERPEKTQQPMRQPRNDRYASSTNQYQRQYAPRPAASGYYNTSHHPQMQGYADTFTHHSQAMPQPFPNTAHQFSPGYSHATLNTQYSHPTHPTHNTLSTQNAHPTQNSLNNQPSSHNPYNPHYSHPTSQGYYSFNPSSNPSWQQAYRPFTNQMMIHPSQLASPNIRVNPHHPMMQQYFAPQ